MSDQSTYPPPTRTLPQSDALSEAEPLSTQDLFNRNPEGCADRHIDAIVMEMRVLRTRLEATGSIGPAPRVSASRTNAAKMNVSAEALKGLFR